MNIAGVIILYHPPESLVENITSYLPFLNALLIYDNTEIHNPLLHEQLYKLANVTVFHDGENKGISQRLNIAAGVALQEHYDWLLTMDQDSNFSEGVFEKYLRCISSMADKSDIAMFGANHETKSVFKGCSYITVTHLITSGSIINLKMFIGIGGFDEALFIDEVDTDYCYSAILKGYGLIRFENIYLNHTLGSISLHKSLKTFQQSPRTLHSPIRLYYMVRNYLYVNKKYPGEFSEEKKRRRTDLMNRIKNNLLYGEDRVQLLKFTMRGWLDFTRNKMGMLVK